MKIKKSFFNQYTSIIFIFLLIFSSYYSLAVPPPPPPPSTVPIGEGFTITLTSPLNATSITAGNISFVFIPVTTKAVSSCQLILNSNPSTYLTPITPNSTNTIITNLAQGVYAWAITCYAGTTTADSETRTLTVTLTSQPVVNLVAPLNNSSHNVGQINFSFLPQLNTTITSCSLNLNGVVADTDIEVSDGVLNIINISITAPGNYSWNVSCSTGNSTVSSQTRVLKIINQTQPPSNVTYNPILSVLNNEYETGESASITGSGFRPSSSLSFVVRTDTKALLSTTITTDSEGKFTYEYIIPDDVEGLIYLRAVDSQMVNILAETSFKVVAVSDVPVTGGPPEEEIPENIPREKEPDLESPTEEIEEKKNTLSTILLFLILLILITSLIFLGYLYFEHKLDLSSFSGFTQSISSVFKKKREISPPIIEPPINLKSEEKENIVIKNFILSQREKGFDDLTIRDALVKKGWPEYSVDNVFEELYKGG